MYKVKFSNGKIMSFSSKDELLLYVSNNWGVTMHQIEIKDTRITLVDKLGSIFAVIGIIEQKKLKKMSKTKVIYTSEKFFVNKEKRTVACAIEFEINLLEIEAVQRMLTFPQFADFLNKININWDYD